MKGVVTLDEGNRDPVLAVIGDCDPEQASSLVRLGASALDAGARNLAVDLSATKYFSEYCLGALVSLRRLATHHGATMTLRNPSSAARQRIETAGVGELFTIHYGT
jgi:anti-anti-sigma factor